PTHLVSVRQRHRPPDAGSFLQRRGEQPERGGRAEPDPIALVLARDLDRPPGHRPGRQQHRRVLADHREGLVGVELLPALPAGGVHDQGVRRLAYGEVVNELLDPTRARGEVIGDQQSAAAPRRGSRHRSPRAYARAAAIRSTTDGWLANIRYSRRGGSTSERFVVASRRSINSTAAGSS